MGSPAHLKAYLALGAVYFFWGTTYLAIRMALEAFPPLFLIGFRFLMSGGILLVASKIMGAALPKGRDLWKTAAVGLLLLGAGNGALVFSEMWIPSGLAALFVTTSPFWMVGLESVLPGGDRLHMPSLIGIVVGLLGVVLLVAPGATDLSTPANAGLLKGFVVLQLGCFCWSLGSILYRRMSTTKVHPVVSGAVQQFATGLVFMPAALAANEHPVRWGDRGTLAVAWLIIFGSVVGYSAYIYSMQHLPVPIVSTYSYVNPIVAVSLGWLFYHEPFGWRETMAMLTVFAGVALVKYYSSGRPQAAVEAAEA
jgi:drug/metabolite transporter (DMT)-like permease